MLPPELKSKAQSTARKIGISLGELIRESIEYFLKEKNENIKDDPFFSDSAVFQGKAPVNGSTHLDDYLYGDNE